LRAIAIWTGALAGLMLILAGGLVSAAVPLPGGNGSLQLVTLPMTLQVPALLLTALVCGPRSAMLAAVAYLSIGLFQLPVFQGGGGPGYLLEPGFGYLVGFVPAAWLSGRLARQGGMDDLLSLFGVSLLGLAVLQVCGLLNLMLGRALVVLGLRFQAYGVVGGVLLLTLWVWLVGVIIYYCQCFSLVCAPGPLWTRSMPSASPFVVN
jgi:biotin transport system substrate-specific component